MTDPVDPQLVREVMGTLPLTDPAVTPEFVEEMVTESAKMPGQVWRTALAELLSARPPTEDEVPDVRTLVVAGEDDLLLGSDSQQALADAWGAWLVVLPDAGHLVARVPEERAPKASTEVALTADASKIHVFDSATERRLA